MNTGFDNRFQKAETGVASGNKYWNSATASYSSCRFNSCPYGSHVEGVTCQGDRKNARWEGGFLGIGASCYWDEWNHTNNKFIRKKGNLATGCPIVYQRAYATPL
jgi:hypothetical protein